MSEKTICTKSAIKDERGKSGREGRTREKNERERERADCEKVRLPSRLFIPVGVGAWRSKMG